MVISFKYDEKGYEKWLQENQFGFVFNYFKTASFNKLHNSSCSYLNRSWEKLSVSAD